MPVATFNKKYLSSLVGNLPDDKLSEEINKLGINIEKLGEDEISVEISSNRPDLISAVGFARALQLYSHRSKRYNYAIRDHEPVIEVNVGRAVKKVRPCIASFVVMGLRFTNESLAELLNSMDKFTDTYGRARRKIAIGMHNLDVVEGKLTYDAYADGRFVPLNSSKEMSYRQVLEDTDKGKKYAGALQHGKAMLYPALKDAVGTLALIPILNSERTKVSASTRNVLIDVTGYSEYMINKTADMLAAIFIDMNGEVKRARINYQDKEMMTPMMETREIMMPTRMAERDIGVEIGPNNVASLAAKMGYDAAYIGNKVRFNVPPYRLDVINEQDIVEDIAIAYGYDYINPVPIRSVLSGLADPAAIRRTGVSELMVGLGFNQMMNSYLTNDTINFTNMRIEGNATAIRIKNPKSEAITMMRTWVLPSLLRNIALSLNEKTPLSVFEYDMVFSLSGKKPSEAYHLAAASSDPKVNFNGIKSVFEALSYTLGLRCKLERYGHGSFIEGRCAKASADGKAIGFFGEVHPEVLNAFGIEEPTVAMELEL